MANTTFLVDFGAREAGETSREGCKGCSVVFVKPDVGTKAAAWSAAADNMTRAIAALFHFMILSENLSMMS